jgi:hypothetical protein
MSLRSVWDEIAIIMDLELRILQAAWSVVSYMMEVFDMLNTGG